MTNRAFEELERRCKNMDRRRYIKWFLILFSVFIVFLFAYFQFFENRQVATKKDTREYKKGLAKEIIKSKNIVKTKQKSEISGQVYQKKIVANKIKPKKIVKKIKSLPKEEKRVISKKIPDYNTLLLNPHIVIPKIAEYKESDKKALKSVSQKTDTFKKNTDIKKKKFNIKVKSFKDEKSLLKDNRVNENFETTMKLSGYYFDKSEYQKAIYWSKKANHYKPSSFKPWFIYAKAKIKQHKRSEAIKAIEIFLSYFDSNNARKFLLKIKGK